MDSTQFFTPFSITVILTFFSILFPPTVVLTFFHLRSFRKFPLLPFPLRLLPPPSLAIPMHVSVFRYVFPLKIN